jgi:serine/threonine protein kinase
MGEVYRALDTQLEREVAIKVLPRVLANDPERLARFEREAKVLAALNHPNITVIYRLAEARGQRALVMELVPGETLAAVIKKRKALPFTAAAPIARQIAEALEAAHDKGIIHRDLKPGNVMVTLSGLVKVLDFGLAAMAEEEAVAAADASGSPTPTVGRTLAGTILGTAAYVSPEQVSGSPADKRSDIWSYGAVLWEMLTGKRLFESGKTLPQTLDDVLHADIDFRKLPQAVPPSIVELLRRCLNRDVTTRLRDIGEARVAIARCLADPRGASTAAPKPEARAAKLAWVLAAAGLFAAVVVGLLHFREPAPEARVVRTTILPPEKTTFAFATNYGPVQLSPDGRRMVFAATGEDGKNQLWVRSLDSSTAQPLPGTQEGTFPFWAPDSRWVGSARSGRKVLSTPRRARWPAC